VLDPTRKDPGVPPVGDTPLVAKAETIASDPEPIPTAPPVGPAKSSHSEGGPVPVTFSVPPRCIEKLRRLAQQANLTQADVLVTELARLSAAPIPVEPKRAEPKRATAGEFELTSTASVREPRGSVSIRLTARNLAAMDALCERLGVANRSALVTKALT